MLQTPKDSHYARLRRAHRDRVEKNKSPVKKFQKLEANKKNFIYGYHSVIEALKNPKRTLHKLYLTQNTYTKLKQNGVELGVTFDIVHSTELKDLLGPLAVHQGIALETDPLILNSSSKLKHARLILILDQITDPHNVGAIIRSSVAFKVDALISTSRHAPHETAVLAKSASGALEHIDYRVVTNLASQLETLREMGFKIYGLDSEGKSVLNTNLDGQKIALVLGAEGKGLRNKTRTVIDQLVCLDVPGPIKSLNVSNAAAISLSIINEYFKKFEL